MGCVRRDGTVARGDGTRRERRAGVWEVRVVVDVDPHTRRSKQQSWTIRGDEDHVATVQAGLVAEFGMRRVRRPTDATTLSVVELVEQFLAAPKAWSPSTYRSYGTPARFLARDPLGEVLLGRLIPARVDTAILRWERDGAGPAVVLGRYRLIHSAITWAMHEQLLRFDPLAGHRAPRAPLPRKHLHPTLGRNMLVEADRLAEKARAALEEGPGSRARSLAAFRAEQTALLIRVVADTGARLGELTALQVGDLEGGRLTIERAAKGGGVIGPTKTHRRRTITLGAVAADRWRVHVEEWKSSPPRQPGVWLFTTTPEAVQPLTPTGVTLRFRRLRTSADVPEATLHRFRHTVGTHLVRSGDLIGAKARLGHDNLATTLRHYVDDDGIDDRPTATALDGLYNDDQVLEEER